MRKVIATAAGVAAAGAAAAAYHMRGGRNGRTSGARTSVYRVMPAGEQWVVEGADGDIPVRCDTKRAALDSGRTMARGNTPSRLVIHRADGTFQREHAYGSE